MPVSAILLRLGSVLFSPFPSPLPPTCSPPPLSTHTHTHTLPLSTTTTPHIHTYTSPFLHPYASSFRLVLSSSPPRAVKPWMECACCVVVFVLCGSYRYRLSGAVASGRCSVVIGIIMPVVRWIMHGVCLLLCTRPLWPSCDGPKREEEVVSVGGRDWVGG